MLTYEKVLSVFEPFLNEDDTYDVVVAKHGYTVLNGDADRRELYGALLCRTPEELRDTLLDGYREFRSYQMIADNTDRNTTEAEEEIIEAECRALIAKCE